MEDLSGKWLLLYFFLFLLDFALKAFPEKLKNQPSPPGPLQTISTSQNTLYDLSKVSNHKEKHHNLKSRFKSSL